MNCPHCQHGRIRDTSARGLWFKQCSECRGTGRLPEPIPPIPINDPDIAADDRIAELQMERRFGKDDE